MIFIVYFIGSIGLIYCRLIFKLANRKRGHTICTENIVRIQMPQRTHSSPKQHTQIHIGTLYVYRIIHTHCTTFTAINPKNTNSSAAYRAPNRRCRYICILWCLHVVMLPTNICVFFLQINKFY